MVVSADSAPSADMRIVSLLPSATEIVFALGLGDDLVGVTFECDFPPDPRAGREVVVGGLDTHGLTPEAIDALVRATGRSRGRPLPPRRCTVPRL